MHCAPLDTVHPSMSLASEVLWVHIVSCNSVTPLDGCLYIYIYVCVCMCMGMLADIYIYIYIYIYLYLYVCIIVKRDVQH